MLALRKNISLDRGTVGRLLKMFSSHAVEVRLDLVPERMVQVNQRYALNEALLDVPRSGHIPGGIVPSFE